MRVFPILILAATVAGAAAAASEPGASSPAAKPGLTTDCSNLVADARKECESRRATEMRSKAHENATQHALDTPEQKAADKARQTGKDPAKAADKAKEKAVEQNTRTQPDQ